MKLETCRRPPDTYESNHGRPVCPMGFGIVPGLKVLADLVHPQATSGTDSLEVPTIYKTYCKGYGLGDRNPKHGFIMLYVVQ